MADDIGCMLEFIPKYYGVLNSTKFINLSCISEDYLPDTKLFFGRRCAIQIHNIWLPDSEGQSVSLRNFVLPLLYLEKLLLQTIFDRQFFNAKHLYDKDGEKSNIQRTLFNLILSCTAIALFQQENPDLDGKVDKRTRLLIITRYFPDMPIDRHEHIQYAVDLLQFWCSQRTFITFESFAAEIPFMIGPLKNYFVWREDKRSRYQINIDNLQIIMPKLKHYRNFNKHVVVVQPRKRKECLLKPSSNSIIDTIDHNLIHYYQTQFSQDYGAQFGIWCRRNNYDDQDIEIALQPPFHNCDRYILQFDKESFDLGDVLDDDCEEYRRVWLLLSTASKPNLLTILYVAMPSPAGDEVDEKQYSDFNIHSPTGSAPVLLHGKSISMGFDNPKHKYDEHDAIYRALPNCQRHEIPSEICDILEELGFWNYKKERRYRRRSNHSKDDIESWKHDNKHKLEEFYVPISKLHKASRQDFIKIAKKTELLQQNPNMIEKLCDQLIERLFTDIERMKPWKCSVCWFMNRKIMVGGLWALYNQLNECGLCGAEGNKRKTSKRSEDNRKTSKRSKPYREPSPNIAQLPTDLKAWWNDIHNNNKHGICSINRDRKVFLENFTVDDTILYITKWILMDINGVTSLGFHKDSITHYFQKQHLNGYTFIHTNKKEMINSIVAILGKNRLKGKVNRLYVALTKHIKKVTIDCVPMKRIAVILKHYHCLSEKLNAPSDRYSCSIRQFLSAFDPKDSRLQLLEDFEHVLQHRASIRAKQPYIERCNHGEDCIHKIRIQKSQDKLSQQQQQQLFHSDDWMDYEYILYLDKIHCTFCHSNESFEHGKEKHIIRRYSHFAVYSTGVYIDHSSHSPLHVNLKEELIHNSVYTMTEPAWDYSLQQAQGILSTKWQKDDAKWRAKVTNEIYGIRIGDRIQIEHILAVYLYTSNSSLCSKFRESYRSSEYDNNNQNIRSYHINNFYWMGRFIYTGIQFFGQKPATRDRFYHGLKQQFLFTEFSVTIEPPTSTTKDRDIAQRIFAGDNGTVLTLKPKFKYQLNNSKYLDVSAISNYGKEEERLFA
eukprot:87176_1